MPNADFFDSLGVLVLEDVLEPAACAALARKMPAAPSAPARVGYQQVNESARRTRTVAMPRGDRALVKRRLMALKPALERRFSVALSDCDVSFLMYRRGDFNRPHRDRSGDPKSPFSRRQVSLVLFLNAQAPRPRPGFYTGGSLKFHGLMGERPGWSECAFALPPEPGRLVAFRSDVRHEVETVSSGRRFTVVGWFR